MHTEPSSLTKQGSSRLGGARADFVGGLGRKIGDLRNALAKIQEAPEDLTKREELRRKLHALGSGAKMMKFDAMDRAIAEALGTLDKTGIDEAMDPADLSRIEQVLEDLPALAWGESPSRTPSEEPPKVVSTPTWTALVVGPPVIAEALLEDGEGRPTFGCDSTPSAQAAFDLAIQLAPDLVLVDADIDDAEELVEALLDDKRTEGTPIVVLGSFLEPGDAERYVAMGVTKTVPKPTSRDALRTICEKTLERSPAASLEPEVRAERGRQPEGPSTMPPPSGGSSAQVEEVLARIENLKELLRVASQQLSDLHAEEAALAKKRTQVLSDACTLLASAIGESGQAPPPLPGSSLEKHLTAHPSVDISEVAELVESLRPPATPKVE